MNPRNTDFTNRAATSPALFNRCVVDWFGDWSTTALQQIGHEFTVHSVEVNEKVENVSRRDLVSALVAIHAVAQSQCEKHRQRTGLCTYVTPRHYLDLISNVVQFVKEKRSELSARRKHVTCGLQKLGDTEKQVTVLQSALDSKKLLLQEKSRLANEKLEQMMHDQSLAEKKRDESLRISSDLQEQKAQIERRKEIVEKDLANVEPALLEAKSAVQNIKKEQLDELRGFNNPPKLVKLALEPVMLLLGYTKLSWADVRRALRKNDFIPSILQFDSDAVPKATRSNVLLCGYSMA
jgi:dynein heavy chain 1